MSKLRTGTRRPPLNKLRVIHAIVAIGIILSTQFARARSEQGTERLSFLGMAAARRRPIKSKAANASSSRRPAFGIRTPSAATPGRPSPSPASLEICVNNKLFQINATLYCAALLCSSFIANGAGEGNRILVNIHAFVARPCGQIGYEFHFLRISIVGGV
ncbi:MAG TPA: hypothetical protein VGO59_03745 [Verrucomicrobiae bacterium]|jgi:hypothetical protein